MIQFKSFDRDFKAIQTHVGEFMPQRTLDILHQGLSDNINEILVETPYVDKDFRDTYYKDFSKRFLNISRDSIRLHFFSEKGAIKQESYLGFVTLRDTKVYTIGRSYLNPRALKYFEPGYFCLAEYKVQVKGIKLTVEAFPWMEQDGDVTRCAHVALWGINRYYSQKNARYPERFLHEITEHDSSTRKVPSQGATFQQITQVLTDSKFSPELYFRKLNKDGSPADDKGDFDRLIYTYIESGIPCIGGLWRKRHAVSIVGHGGIKAFDEVVNDNKKIIDSYKFFQEIILSNDNHLPYSRAYNYVVEGHLKYEDIDALIVPFDSKMYLDAKRLFDKILPIFQKMTGINDEHLVRRVFLTSSNAYKSFINNFSEDEKYKELQLKMQMPKFIWVAEYSTPEEYKDERVRHRFIFDATMLNFDNNVFLCIKKSKLLFSRSTTEPDVYLLDNETEKVYTNNLVPLLD